jgi:hypothetical protein
MPHRMGDNMGNARLFYDLSLQLVLQHLRKISYYKHINVAGKECKLFQLISEGKIVAGNICDFNLEPFNSV